MKRLGYIKPSGELPFDELQQQLNSLDLAITMAERNGYEGTYRALQKVRAELFLFFGRPRREYPVPVTFPLDQGRLDLESPGRV